MEKRISLKDIARKAGVSTALVSYVLNNQKEGRINKEVAGKIREIAADLHYRPNQIARSLKTHKTYTIGLVVADISNPFSSGLARIIEDEASGLGYTVIFGSSDENEKKCEKLIDTFMNRQVDGLILFPPAGSESQILELQKQGIPFVLVDRYFPGITSNTVCIDNHAAAFSAVQHLITSGRKRIGMIGYDSPLVTLQEREKGYFSAFREAGIIGSENWLQKVSIRNDAGEIEDAVKALISANEPVDALLFGANRIAYYALKYINAVSIKVPGELALISFDESDVFDLFYAPLTYIRQPLREIGQTATRLLLENIQKRTASIHVDLPAELVVRKSTMRN